MGGPNLEVFKFGMYIAFPIGIMWYFGTNLDNRFAVPEFWPRPEQTNKVPYEREEIKSEIERMRARRLQMRAVRLENEAKLRELEDAKSLLTQHTEDDTASAPVDSQATPRSILSYLGFGQKSS